MQGGATCTSGDARITQTHSHHQGPHTENPQQLTLSLSIHLCMVSHAKGQPLSPIWAVASPALPARARSAIWLAASLQRSSSTLAPAQHHQAGSGEHAAPGNMASLTSLQTASFSSEQQSLLATIALAGHCDVWFHARQC